MPKKSRPFWQICGSNSKSKYLYFSESKYNLNSITSSSVARISQMGGAFLEVWNNLKRTWPKFSLVLNYIEAVFLSKLGDPTPKKRSSPKFKGFFPTEFTWSQKKRSSPKFKGFFGPKSGYLQKKKFFFRRNSRNLPPPKKKDLHRLCLSSRTKKLHYSGPDNAKSFTTSAPRSRWRGLFSFLEQKSASKAHKTCYFAYFSHQ